MDPLIKSQLLYQLSYAPHTEAGLIASPGRFGKPESLKFAPGGPAPPPAPIGRRRCQDLSIGMPLHRGRLISWVKALNMML